MQTPSTKALGGALALRRSRLPSFPLHSRSAMGMPAEQGLSMSEGLAATVWRRYPPGTRPKRPEDFSPGLTVLVLVWWHSVEVGDEEGNTSGSGPGGQERQDPADPAQRASEVRV